MKNGDTGCTNTGAITILFDFNQCAISVPETRQNLDEALILQPNPNQGTFSVVVTDRVEDVELTVFDIGGRIVYSATYAGSYHPGDAFRVQPEAIEKGLYFVRLTTPRGYITRKMVVQ